MPRAKLSLCAAVLYACWVSARRRFTSVSHAFTLDFEHTQPCSCSPVPACAVQLFCCRLCSMLAFFAAALDERRIAALLTLMMQEQ